MCNFIEHMNYARMNFLGIFAVRSSIRIFMKSGFAVLLSKQSVRQKTGTSY